MMIRVSHQRIENPCSFPNSGPPEGVILPNISIEDEVTQLLTKHSRLYCQFFLLITETVLERSFIP